MAESPEGQKKHIGQAFKLSYQAGKKIAGHQFSIDELNKLAKGNPVNATLKTNKGYFNATIKADKKGTLSSLTIRLDSEAKNQKRVQLKRPQANKTTFLRRMRNLVSIQNRKKEKSSTKKTGSSTSIEYKQANQYDLLKGAINSGDFKKIQQLSKDFKFEKNSVDSILKQSNLSAIEKKSIQSMTTTQDVISTRKKPLTAYKTKVERNRSQKTQFQINI